jgi:1-acyl-sn-glycerol-3-phosphate acyltransferase
MKALRVGFKLSRTLLHVARGYWIIRRRFPALPAPERERHVQQWSAQMLRILGITLARRGPPLSAGPVLLVANHISWLDILVMHASGYCRFISKADVHHWPLIGAMAAAAGTLFIERESRRDAMRVVHHMAQSLRDGDVLAVFPEGTTGDGLELKPFHANLIQAAIAVQAPAQPLALRFVDGRTGELSLAPRFIDDDTLLSSVLKTLGAQDLQAEVITGDVQLCDGRDRRRWAADLREAVQALWQSGRLDAQPRAAPRP